MSEFMFFAIALSSKEKSTSGDIAFFIIFVSVIQKAG